MADTPTPTLFLNDSAILDQLAVDYRNDTNLRLESIANNTKPPVLEISSKFYDLNLNDYSSNVDYFSPKKKTEDKLESTSSRLESYSNYFNKYEQDNAKLINESYGNLYKYKYEHLKGTVFGIPYDFDLNPDEKYVEGELGWDPKLSTAENEQIYYDKFYKDQNLAKKAWFNLRGVTTNIVAKTPLKFFEGLGYVGSAINPFILLNEKGYFSAIADNGFSQLMVGLEDNLKTGKYSSTYKSIDYDNKGFFDKMGTSEFWVNDFADGAAFMLSAFVPIGGVASKLGKGLSTSTKLLITANKAAKLGEGAANALTSANAITSRTLGSIRLTGRAGKVSNFLFGSREISAPIQHAYSVASEAFFETKGVIDELKRKRNLAISGELNDPELANMSDEAFNKFIGEKGANTFLANSLLLSVTNLFQTRLMYKALGKKAPGTPNFTSDMGGRIVNKSYSNKLRDLFSDNFVNKALNGPSKLARGTKFTGSLLKTVGVKGAVGLGIEGYLEENSQLAIERLNNLESEHMYYFPEDNPAKAFLKQYAGQIYNAKWGNIGTDIESATSIGLGGLLGGGTSIMSSVAQRKKYNIKSETDYNQNNKIEYAGLFDKKEVKKDKEKWYKGFFYGEVKNKRDQAILDNISLMNLQNIYKNYLNVQQIVDSKDEEEFNAKKQNFLNNVNKEEEIFKLSENIDFLYSNKIGAKALRNLAFANYIIAADKVGFGKDVIDAFSEIKTVDPDKLNVLLAEFGVDSNTFKEEDVKFFKEIGNILFENKEKIKDKGFSKGPFTFEVLDILSEHRKNKITDNLLRSFIYKNAIGEHSKILDLSIEKVNEAFSNSPNTLNEMLGFYTKFKEVANLVSSHELIFQELEEKKLYLSDNSEEIKNLKEELDLNIKELKDLFKEIEVNTISSGTDQDSVKEYSKIYSDLLQELYLRYKKELIGKETSTINESTVINLLDSYSLSAKPKDSKKEFSLSSFKNPLSSRKIIEAESIIVEKKKDYIEATNSLPFKIKSLNNVYDLLLELHYVNKMKNSFERLNRNSDKLSNLLMSFDADQYIDWFNKDIENNRLIFEKIIQNKIENIKTEPKEGEEIEIKEETEEEKIERENLEYDEESKQYIEDQAVLNLSLNNDITNIEQVFNDLIESDDIKERIKNKELTFKEVYTTVEFFIFNFKNYPFLLGYKDINDFDEFGTILNNISSYLIEENGSIRLKNLNEIFNLLNPLFEENKVDLGLELSSFENYAVIFSLLMDKTLKNLNNQNTRLEEENQLKEEQLEEEKLKKEQLEEEEFNRLLEEEQVQANINNVGVDIEAKKADIERRRQEELDRETPVKNENIIVNDGTDNLTFKIITFKDGSTLVRHIKTNETTADNKSKKLTTYPTLEDFQNLLKYDFDENAKIIKTELVKDDYTDKQSQEVKATKEKTINAKYDAELKALEQQNTSNQSEIETKKAISNGDKIITVDNKPVTNEIQNTEEDIFILGDKNPEGRIHINMEALKDVLVVPNNNLIIVDKKTGKEIVNQELNKEGAIVFEAMQGRLFVVANINGQLVPFYKSSAGTSGKTQGEWYPFFGYTGAWLVKGSVNKSTGKMTYSSEIDRVTNLLNENLVFPDKYIGRPTNTIVDKKGKLLVDMNKYFKVNRIWQKEFKGQTGTGTNFQIKGLKENTRNESGLIALITGLNTTELDSSKTLKELYEWIDLINKNAEPKALEQQSTTSNQSELEAKKTDIEKRKQAAPKKAAPKKAAPKKATPKKAIFENKEIIDEIADKIHNLRNRAALNNKDLLTFAHEEDPNVVSNYIDDHINSKKDENLETIPFISKALQEVNTESEENKLYTISSSNEIFEQNNPNFIITVRSFLNRENISKHYALKLSVTKDKTNIIGTVVNKNGDQLQFDTSGEEVTTGGNIITFVIDTSYFNKDNIFKSRQESFGLLAPLTINLNEKDKVKIFAEAVEENFNKSFLEDLINDIINNDDFPLMSINKITSGVLFRDGYQNNQQIVKDKNSVRFTTLEELLNRDTENLKITGFDFKINQGGRLQFNIIYNKGESEIHFQPKPKNVREFSTNSTKDGIILYDKETDTVNTVTIEDIIANALKGTLNPSFKSLLDFLLNTDNFLIIPTFKNKKAGLGILSKKFLDIKIKGIDISESLDLLRKYNSEEDFYTSEEFKSELDKILDYPIVFDKITINQFTEDSKLNNVIFVDDSVEEVSGLPIKNIISKNVNTALLPIKEGNNYKYTNVNKRLILHLPIDPKEFKEKRTCK